VGQNVCHSGATSDTRFPFSPVCGKLASKNQTVYHGEGQPRLYFMRRMRPLSGSSIKEVCQGGDSGGPVYWNRTAKGIVSSGDEYDPDRPNKVLQCYYGFYLYALGKGAAAG
jgi:hypothetical protein